jgi:uncharacterized membrane protein YqiK
MSGELSNTVIYWIVAGVVALVILAYLFYWFYRRSTKEIAFVRTGLGGQRVVINGGAFVVPIFHEITPVFMRTHRLVVQCVRDQALITKDRMRVDVNAEFYVRVVPTGDGVSSAAQTLGRRSMETDALRELVEGRFVDILRSVAAEMTMEELHEQRSEYAKRVREAVVDPLRKSGLEAEAVSLTSLDQTDMEFFDPSNAFDAEGLTRLTEQIEQRKKRRNDIEQDTAIAIRRKNLEAERLALEIERDTQYARLEQEREVGVASAAQRAELARQRAGRELEAEQAQISLREGIERSRIAQELAIEQQRIRREVELQRLEVERRTSLELAEQRRAIAVAEHARAQHEAQAVAEQARALAISAEENVFTAREIAVAERRKQIELIAAQQDAEQSSTRLLITARAEREAAESRADAARIEAHGNAEAEKIRAMAAKIRHEVEAEGLRLMNEAQNTLSPEARASALRRYLVERLDAIIRESVRPMEKINEIKIFQVDGLLGGGGQGGDGRYGSGGGGLGDEVVNSALRYRAHAPLIDKLLKEIGLSGGEVGQIAGGDIQKLLGLTGGEGRGNAQLDLLDETQREGPAEYRN